MVEGFPRQEPNGRHRLEESLRSYGLVLMLLGASMGIVSVGNSAINSEHVLLGFSLLIFGAVLLVLSELCSGSRAVRWFAGQVVKVLGKFFGQRL